MTDSATAAIEQNEAGNTTSTESHVANNATAAQPQVADTVVTNLVSQPEDEIDESEDILCPNNDFCFTEDDFLEARTNMNEATRHTGTYNSAWSEIKSLEGESVECRNADGVVTWKIVSGVEDDVFACRRATESKLFREKFCPARINAESEENITNPDDLSNIFWNIWPGYLDSDVEKLNDIIEKKNQANRETLRRALKKVSKSEFIIFHALLIGASIFSQQGEKLWTQDDSKKRKKSRGGLMKGIDFGVWMKAWRFRQIKSLIPQIMEAEYLKEQKDDWWKFKQRIINFNLKRKEKLCASYALVFDESMSAYVPR